MPRRNGFTLIELLISIAIGLALIALGTNALLHVSRAFNRNIAMLQACDLAASIHQRLARSLSAMYHPAQVRLRVDPGESPAVWDDGNEVVELTWMSAQGDVDEPTMDVQPGHVSDLVWNRLRWTGRGSGKDGGRLEYAVSSPIRLSQSIASPAASTSSGSVRTGPQARRDRRRDMDDNDLRHLPGMTAGVYAALQLPGNGADLDRNLRLMHLPFNQVRRLVIEWVDGDGYAVRAGPDSGVTIRNRLGAAQVPIGQPWADGFNHVLDGAWLDARPLAAVGSARLASAQRPLLMRISFGLVTANQLEPADLAHEPSRTCTFTIRTAPMLPEFGP